MINYVHFTVSEAPSTSTAAATNGGGVSVAAKNKARSRNRHKRYTHSEKRYHSEVRQEAVQQALAAMHSDQKNQVKRPFITVVARYSNQSV